MAPPERLPPPAVKSQRVAGHCVTAPGDGVAESKGFRLSRAGGLLGKDKAMDKAKFIESIGRLMGLTEYQCYKGRALKSSLREQAKIISQLGKVCHIDLTPLDLVDCFHSLDIAPIFVESALNV